MSHLPQRRSVTGMHLNGYPLGPSMAHLVHDRIESLERLAAEGKANRFSRKMAYTLFASNLINYTEKYRGIHSLVIHELERFADVQLTTKESGV